MASEMRVGVIGAGNIVKCWLDAIEDTKEIRCTAIYVRLQSIEKGNELAARFGIDHVYTDIEVMLTSEDIDFIYVAVNNTLHYPYAKQALLNNKHVIMEKPFTATLAEAEELASLAKTKELFLFEAVMNLHAPLLSEIEKAIGQIGKIRLVQANFSQVSSRYHNYQKGQIHPAFDPKWYGGALYDLNVYNLNLLIHLFGLPQESYYLANKGFNGIDTSGTVTMRYPDFVVTCTAAKDAAGDNFFMIQGDKGYIRCQGSASNLPVLLVSTKEGECLYQDEDVDRALAREFQVFYQIWQAGNYQLGKDKLRHSLAVVELLEELYNKEVLCK
jgi:Predicted dehydrogenases and related proteins